MNSTRPSEQQISLDESVMPARLASTNAQTRSARMTSERRVSSTPNDKRLPTLRWEDLVKPDDND